MIPKSFCYTSARIYIEGLIIIKVTHDNTVLEFDLFLELLDLDLIERLYLTEVQLLLRN